MKKNSVAIQRATGVVEQQLQDSDIARTEFNDIITAPRSQFYGDDFEITQLKVRRHVWLPRAAASGNRLHAGDDFTKAEGFDDKIVRSDFEPNQPVKFFRLRADENDGNAGGDCPNGATYFVPAVTGHHNIQTDKIR